MSLNPTNQTKFIFLYYIFECFLNIQNSLYVILFIAVNIKVEYELSNRKIKKKRGVGFDNRFYVDNHIVSIVFKVNKMIG